MILRILLDESLCTPIVCEAQLTLSAVGVEKLFSRDFANEHRSQVIECSFAVGAEIHRNYCFGSFFNSHSRFHFLRIGPRGQ